MSGRGCVDGTGPGGFSEPGAVLEFLIAGLDFLAGERAETVHAESLATEAAHHGPVDHRSSKLRQIDRAFRRRDAAAGQVADESAGEAISGASWVEDVFQ